MSADNKDSTLREQIKTMWLMLVITALSLFIDQFTKMLVRKATSTNETIVLIKGWLHLIHSGNSGMAFGMLPGWNHILTFVSIFAIVFILMYYKQFMPTRWMQVSLGLVLGGALGNLVDRILYGYVTDFIRIRWWFSRYRWWPSFNIADACVCVGAAMLIIAMFNRSMSVDGSDQVEPDE